MRTLDRKNSRIDRRTTGIKIRQLRKEKGLTQMELAQRLNASRSSVTSWETGERFPEVRYVQVMARIFGVPVDYLYGLSEHRYNIKVPDYFEFDMTKLNSKGIKMLYEQYKLLLNSEDYTK